MATFSDLEPYIAGDVAGCPPVVIRQTIITTAIDFCKRSKVLQKQLSAGVTSVGTSLYTIVAPDGFQVFSVEEASVNGGNLAPGQAVGIGMPSRFTTEDQGVLKLTPVPTVPNLPVSALCVLVPLITATSVPDLLMNWQEGFCGGVKYRIMAQPGKPWSSADLAVYNEKLYENAILEAYAYRLHGGVKNSIFMQIQRL